MFHLSLIHVHCQTMTVTGSGQEYRVKMKNQKNRRVHQVQIDPNCIGYR